MTPARVLTRLQATADGERLAWRAAPWIAVLLYLALALPQLDLPGLHYDEAKEAGVNAMEMLLRQDVHAFRSAGLQIGSLFLPIMVQDYIGALNVYLALPFLALAGITVSGLRLVGVACGLGTLILTGCLGNELTQMATGRRERLPGLAMLLLAASPSFLFWSRQGIFVTNVVVTLAVATVWVAVRWQRTQDARYLYLLALLSGLGMWAKLLFVWVLGALVALALALRLVQSWRPVALHRVDGRRAASLGRRRRPAAWPWLVAAGLFILPLTPLLLFNQQTSGTLQAVFGNLGRSYYGVQNAAFGANLRVRLAQLVTLLRGDHFWYLGGPFANRVAPWVAAGLVGTATVMALRRREPALLLSLGFLLLLVVQSCFTVSDLFITHYAIIQPFVLLTIALAGEEVWKALPGRRWVSAIILAALVVWLAADVQADLRYHQALKTTGGHAAHSDASYRLAQWLEEQGVAQPIALDWGFEAPLRFLTANRVQPLELFGYEQLDAPDPGFAERLAPFLADPNRLYLFHTPEDTVFRGRRQVLEELAAQRGLATVKVATFPERSGRPLIVVLRLQSQ